MKKKLDPQIDLTNSKQIFAFKIPYFVSSLQSIPKILNHQIIQQALKHEQNIKIGNDNFIEIKKKKVIRPLYEVKVVKYKNKNTGQIVERIEQSQCVDVYYNYLDLPDFQRFTNQRSVSQQKLTQILKQKILDKEKIYPKQFMPPPIDFLKTYNLPILPADMLVNKNKSSDKIMIKSKQILYTDQIPAPPAQIPEYIKNSQILKVVEKYFEKRPCWLRNVLVFKLRQDGYKGKFTINQLKNALKFLSYTFKDGPWKHVFCRYGFNPLEEVEAALYQSVVLKIKHKQIDDYDIESNDQSDNVYDPTLKQIPSKFMKLYQFADIDDTRVQQIVQDTIVSRKQCTKQSGWFSKRDFLEINNLLKKIKEERSMN